MAGEDVGAMKCGGDVDCRECAAATTERLRIRRAQRYALKIIDTSVALIGWDDGSAVPRIRKMLKALDNATKAARKKGRRM